MAEGQGGVAAAGLRVLTGAALQAGESADSGYLEEPDTTKTVDSGLLLLRSRPGGRGARAQILAISPSRTQRVRTSGRGNVRFAYAAMQGWRADMEDGEDGFQRLAAGAA